MMMMMMVLLPLSFTVFAMVLFLVANDVVDDDDSLHIAFFLYCIR